jgi:hypothetical protein
MSSQVQRCDPRDAQQIGRAEGYRPVDHGQPRWRTGRRSPPGSPTHRPGRRPPGAGSAAGRCARLLDRAASRYTSTV